MSCTLDSEAGELNASVVWLLNSTGTCPWKDVLSVVGEVLNVTPTEATSLAAAKAIVGGPTVR